MHGLWLTTDGLHGTVFDEAGQRIVLFEGVCVITAGTFGWSVRDIVAYLATDDTPPGVEPGIAGLTAADLRPLLACGALTRVDVLRLLAHVPGWQP